jgi:hypothetical protein
MQKRTEHTEHTEHTPIYTMIENITQSLRKNVIIEQPYKQQISYDQYSF